MMANPVPTLEEVVAALVRNATINQNWTPEDALIVEAWLEDQEPVPETKPAPETGGES
jgi:hypothetical protein